ncbi:pro-sigmaK processing inhibitor BofA family protein [Metabacillus arenae]|uniref:Pro-sigmaK processing inhibitor BofA family protein n=1 Tax=Metabacillus arenae TaxID=2771434 RepID=A0A926RYZ0_9BACI|nr:pro-sigmaK processing inhibitor BofA family protein [Metabacillus arenae]MBD1383478.1 pro-sigmaK processing inhibitor BofA family protein [Metabacillus arenae]
MEPVVIFSIVGAAILLLLFVGAPVKPLQWIGRLFIKVIVGAILLFLLNAFGTNLGLHIPINLVTSTITGLLGIPGLAALVIIKHVIFL